jgi:hypothetical protein
MCRYCVFFGYVFFGVVLATATASLVGIRAISADYGARRSDVGPSRSAKLPRAVLKENNRDLGVLDREDACRHTFIIRNDGDAPLKIAKAGTSCKCTVSVLPAGDIPPGKGGPIEIESKTDGVEGAFSHTAEFATNDPKLPRFELTIRGVIRDYLAARPSSIQTSDLAPGKPVEMSTVIVSEAWDSFTLENVTTSLEGLTWEFQPASAEVLREHKAKAGYVATFRLPADRFEKAFSGWVEAEAEADDRSTRSDEPSKTSGGRSKRFDRVRMVLSGNAASIRTVFGPHVDHEGVVSIGTLRFGQGARVYLLLQVRGEHREIRVKDIQKSPAFLKVSVEAQSPELAKKGLYRILIEVPPDAPACNHTQVDRIGALRVITDHPEMPEIVQLKVAFAVLSR